MRGSFHQPLKSAPRSNAPPLDLWLSFDNGMTIGLGTRGDGNLHVEVGTPAETQMGEAGAVVVHELSDRDPFSQVHDQRLVEVYCLSEAPDPPMPPCVGYRLVFENAGQLIILNWGDELFVANRLPPDAEEEDLLEARLE